MGTIEGLRSFAGVRARSRLTRLDAEVSVRVASLGDIIKSKRAGRPQDLAVLPVLEKTLEETSNPEAKAGGAPQGE